jgi:hypothetical protein
MDGRWKLEDLYVFPHAFSQCYSFIYCFDTQLNPRDRDRINEALSSYPWGGGYSYVNIYSVLYHQLPRIDRPEVKAISYASPGWLDILLNADVAIQVAKSVTVLAGSVVAAAKAYSAVARCLTDISVERKNAQLKELRLTQLQHKTLISMCQDMANFLGFKNVKGLHEHTGNPEVSLKLLAAHYRRTKQLVEFVNKGKASLPTEDGNEKNNPLDV